MGKKSGPKAPDPYKVSEAQTQSNRDTALFNAQLNRVDQQSPFGSISWSHTGDDPASGWSQTTSLSPELQGLLDSQIGAQGGISNAITGALGNLPTGPFNPNIDVGDIRQRSMDSQLAMLNPEFERGRKTLEGTMSDRGIPIGSEIFRGELDRFEGAKNNSLLAASRQADQDANSEYQRQFGNELTKFQMPMQQLSALMGASSPVQNPSFSPFAQSSSAGTDVAGNIWQKYAADQQAAQQSNGQLFNGLLGLGQLGMAAFSDARLKRDIKRIGALPSGLPVYSYKYLWSEAEEVGVLAQEALQYAPRAVFEDSSGFLKVRYDLL